MKTKHHHRKKLKTKVENKKKIKKKSGAHGTILVSWSYNPEPFSAGPDYASSNSSNLSGVHVPAYFDQIPGKVYTVTGDALGLQKLNTYAGATLLDKVISARYGLVPNGISHWQMATVFVGQETYTDPGGSTRTIYVYSTSASQTFPYRFL
jgi:hypothetical protein